MPMFNFDADRFVKIQTGAVALAAEIDAAAERYVAEGIDSVFFLGTGGAAILMYPAANLLAQHSRLKVFTERAAELVLTDHRSLGPRSLIFIPSLSGTTKESVKLLAFLKERGVRTLSLTGHKDTPLAQEADHNFTNFAEDDTSSEMFYLQTLIIVLAILAERGEFKNWDAVVADLQKLPKLLVDAKEAFEGKAATLAADIKDEKYHIFTGAGSVWPEAYYYGMCILEEMQWIRTRPVHAADFFHGTLELVEQGVSVFVFKGEDASRPLGDRVEAFAKRYTDKVRVLDTADVKLSGISAETRSLISPVILATLLERLSAHLEVLRNHPLTTRRYYKRVEY